MNTTEVDQENAIILTDLFSDQELGTVVFYTNLTPDQLQTFLKENNNKKFSFTDIAIVPQRDLQYYSIDDRVWLSQKQENAIREFLNEQPTTSQN